jgi:hypothetical protein
MPIHPTCQRSRLLLGISAAFFGNVTNEAEPQIDRGRYHEAGAADKVFRDSQIASVEISQWSSRQRISSPSWH